jgi:hypothetical protein
MIWGVVSGTKNVATNTLDAVVASTTRLIKTTSDLGGNVAQAAKGAIQGTIMRSKEMGENIVDAWLKRLPPL